MQVQIDNVLEAFREALNLVEDEEQRERFARVLAASRASVERAVQDLIAELAAEITEELGEEFRVELRYEAGGISVDVSSPPPEDGDGDEDEPLPFQEGEAERLTLRLPLELKERATGAAAQEGLSLNAWMVRMLARAVIDDGGRQGRRRGRRAHRDDQGGGRLRGWVGS